MTNHRWLRCVAIALSWLLLLVGVPSAVSQDGSSTSGQTRTSDAGGAYRTGLERSDGERTTTADEAIAVLDAIVADSPRAAYAKIGESELGDPIHLVRIGHPAAPQADAIPSGRNVLFIAAQHGNEPAGREGVLRLIRELAFTDDAELVNQLSEVNVLVIPTANPDGFAADRRRNESNIDTNRDHVTLQTVEARVMASVIQMAQPEIVVDAHESGNPPHKPEQTARLEALWPSNLNADEAIRSLSREMIEGTIFSAVREAGYEAKVWGGRGGHEGVLRNTVGLRHHPGMVIESFRATAADRADLQHRTMRAVLKFHRQRGDDIVSAIEAARQRSSARDDRPYYFGGTEREAPKRNEIDEEPPAGYLINAVQMEAVASQIERFGLAHREVRPGVHFVPMSQPMRPVIPMIFDERAPRSVAKATRVDDLDRLDRLDPPPLPPPPSSPARYPIDFAEVSEGEIGNGWSEPWSESEWKLDSDAAALRHRVDGSKGRRVLVWDRVGTAIGDVEVHAAVRGDAGNTLFQLAIHVSGEAGRENAYYVDARVEDGTLRINRYDEGRFSTLRTTKFPASPGEWYQVRLRREGDRLMARIWADGEAEPDRWMVTTRDAAHRSGRIGLAGFQPGSTNEWRFVRVGVGGEPAP